MIDKQRKAQLRKLWLDAIHEIAFREPFADAPYEPNRARLKRFIDDHQTITDEELDYLIEGLHYEIGERERVEPEQALKLRYRYEGITVSLYALREHQTCKFDWYKYGFTGPSLITYDQNVQGSEWYETYVDRDDIWERIGRIIWLVGNDSEKFQILGPQRLLDAIEKMKERFKITAPADARLDLAESVRRLCEDAGKSDTEKLDAIHQLADGIIFEAHGNS